MIEELYTVHRQELERYCRTMCSNPEMAEDIVQEVYIRAMSNLDTLAGLDRSQRRAWLYKAARNLYVDMVRKSAARKAREEKCLPPEETGDPFAELEAAQLILMLPQQDRALFSMRYMKGYSAGALEKLEYLYVDGDVSVPQPLVDAFCRLGAVYNELKIVKLTGGGLEICDRLIVNITSEMLKRCPDGLLVSDCAKVVLAEDAEPDMIQERLRIDDVAKVVCTPEQRIAVELVCGDVSLISDGGAAADRDDYGSEYDEYYSDYDYDHESGAGRGGNTVVINAASYKM